MILLTGETGSRAFISDMQRVGIGRMFTVRRPKPFLGEPWGFDNGAYSYFRNGQVLDFRVFLERVRAAWNVGTPYMAVIPDVVAGGMESLWWSVEWAMKLPPEWPWYLVVQDGMDPSAVEDCLEYFDGIFLGGTDQFKLTAIKWCNLAHAHDKRFHYGRAGTPTKLQAAANCGADSCDSAFPLWNRERWEGFVRFAETGSSFIYDNLRFGLEVAQACQVYRTESLTL